MRILLCSVRFGFYLAFFLIPYSPHLALNVSKALSFFFLAWEYCPYSHGSYWSISDECVPLNTCFIDKDIQLWEIVEWFTAVSTAHDSLSVSWVSPSSVLVFHPVCNTIRLLTHSQPGLKDNRRLRIEHLCDDWSSISLYYEWN